MQFLFPYHKVRKNSSIILYGLGNVGKQFYRQLVQTGYCEIAAWSDKIIKDCDEAQGKLIPPDKIKEFDFDCLVIAVLSPDVAVEIKTELIDKGIDPQKLVWDGNYELRDMRWPDNTDFFLHNGDFLLEIMDLFCSSRQQFGEGGFYQSYPAIGLRGQRPTQERIETYGLKQILKKDMDVLDIGCNCGFFDMQIAESVRSVTGLEINRALVQIAEITRKHLNIRNCNFLETDFCSWHTENKYDMVFAFAILCWIKLEPEEIAEHLLRLIKKDGWLLIESHNIKSKDRLNDFDTCIKKLKEDGMYEIWKGTTCDDGVISRRFVLLQNVRV